MKALVALAKEKFGKIDAVFANAGIMPAGNMSELKVADWNAMIEINIKGVLNTMAAVLPEFIAQKKGHILVTSSRAGMMSVPGNAVYCGTKHFVDICVFLHIFLYMGILGIYWLYIVHLKFR